MKWFRRIGLDALNLSVALAAVLGVYVYRALYVLECESAVPGLTQPVQVSRDCADVTHIEATSERDAWFEPGCVHAQEPGWQLEFNCRVMHVQFVDSRDKLGQKKNVGIADMVPTKLPVSSEPTKYQDLCRLALMALTETWLRTRITWCPPRAELHIFSDQQGFCTPGRLSAQANRSPRT